MPEFLGAAEAYYVQLKWKCDPSSAEMKTIPTDNVRRFHFGSAEMKLLTAGLDLIMREYDALVSKTEQMAYEQQCVPSLVNEAKKL